ncbi:DUF2620 domain-containing protein [Tepidimicrobium xylanilyticum]|uniref:DUF2620 domain-containing protein n=1 Tax=Tepidimicrobium xylanilyticum TaxID=1123352 RepID=UPI002654F9FB|nr:DUF2620 domain-containing protein [Tepidimicrobium xylanilyticum]GMG95439.1 hypothetical protein EN5CB1_02650 [Tepidimicrobium xylanilyticum]
MVNIVVGGQMDKQLIGKLIEEHGKGKVKASVKGDIEAVLDVKNGQADYYFGSCATGAGGALAMAIGLIGAQNCVSVSIPGKILTEEEMRKAVREGKKAFGFVNTDAEKVIPVLIDEILKKEE